MHRLGAILRYLDTCREPLDRRYFGPIATNFEHHASTISGHGTIRGIEHDMAGDLRCDACGIGRGLCDRGGDAA